MSHLELNELAGLADSIYISLFGKEIYGRWQTLKQHSNCDSEKHFMSWILDVVDCSLDAADREFTMDPDSDTKPKTSKVDEVHNNSERNITNKVELTGSPEVSRGEVHGEDVKDDLDFYSDVANNSGGDLSIQDDWDKLPPSSFNSSATGVSASAATGTNLYNNLLASNSGSIRAPSYSTSEFTAVSGQYRFTCDMCNATFKTRHSAVRHRVTVHSADKTFYCTYCRQTFTTRKDRVDHENVAHATLMKFKCDFCDKRFFRKDRQVRHQNAIHLKLRRFPCATCGMAFPSNFNLRDHVNRVHIGSKRFCCPYCYKALADKTSYIYHLRCVHKEQE